MASEEEQPTSAEDDIAHALRRLPQLGPSEWGFLDDIAFSLKPGWRMELALITKRHWLHLSPRIRVLAALKGWA